MYFKKSSCILLLLVITSLRITAQTGSFTGTFTPSANFAKAVSVKFSKPVFKFDNTHGYWFVNPHNGYRHFNIQPDQGYGSADAVFITINESTNDFDLYTLTPNDSDQVMLQTGDYFITPPAYDPKLGDANKPMHIHINSITAGEISFSLSGAAALGTQKGNGSMLGNGTINGSGHFFREAKYDRSETLSGCDCDPVIYASTYSREDNMRTTSQCENALANKVFDAVQKSMAPLFTDVDYGGKGTMKAGQITVGMIAGHSDLTSPKDRPYCFSDFYRHRITGIDAHKHIYSNEDSYGLRLIKAPENKMDGDNFKKVQQEQSVIMDSISKLMNAGKISSAVYAKAINTYSEKINAASGIGDIKKDEAEYNLYITVLINPTSQEMMLQKTDDKSKTVVTHSIKGAAFEVASPLTKYDTEHWTPSRYFIYFGKFTPPKMGKSGGGFDAEVTTAIYPANAPKLGIYNIIIKMEGGKDLAEKALAAIDMEALQALITK